MGLILFEGQGNKGGMGKRALNDYLGLSEYGGNPQLVNFRMK